MSLQQLNLQYDPFKDLTPNISDDFLIWGGMDEIKNKIQRCYADCLNNNSKQIVLNWGPYGGGKTFSAYYFSNSEGQTDNLTHIYIRSPKDGSKATDELFKSVIDNLTFEVIQEQVRSILNIHGEENFIRYLTPKSSREFAKAILLIGSENEEIADTMNRFLYTGITLTELKKLGLAKKIQTDTDRVKFLAGIISCFTGNNEMINGRVVLWIDELEDLIYYSPKNYKSFSQVLRDLFDNIPDRFLTFMNFTLAEGQEATIELILGGAVWSRITKKLRFKEFSHEDALKYCRDLLSAAKIKKNSDQPLTEDLLGEIINNIPDDNLTPREINRHISSLFKFALSQNANEINQETFNKWMAEFSEEN